MSRSIHLFCRCLAVAIAGFALCEAGSAQTTVAYDGFNYTSGTTLSGQNGGTGWTGAWTNDYGPGVSFVVNGSGLTYPNLATSGRSIVWASGGVGISEDSRTLPLQDSGVVYVQFIAQFTEGSGGGTPNIRLYDSGTLTGGLGANGGLTLSILNANLQPNGTTSTSSVATSGTNFVVARIDYTNDNTEMWVNPDLSTFNYSSPAARRPPPLTAVSRLSSTTSPSTPATMRMWTEIQVLAVPEPGTGALLATGVGIAGLLGWRRLVRNAS